MKKKIKNHLKPIARKPKITSFFRNLVVCLVGYRHTWNKDIYQIYCFINNILITLPMYTLCVYVCECSEQFYNIILLRNDQQYLNITFYFKLFYGLCKSKIKEKKTSLRVYSWKRKWVLHAQNSSKFMILKCQKIFMQKKKASTDFNKIPNQEWNFIHICNECVYLLTSLYGSTIWLWSTLLDHILIFIVPYIAAVYTL